MVDSTTATITVDTTSFPSWLTYDQPTHTLSIQSPAATTTINAPLQIDVTATEHTESVTDSFTLTVQRRVQWSDEFQIDSHSENIINAAQMTALIDGNI
eukprot:CAMPEP_0114994112 /NCGR_PEP_ID=MMETSP0216-20121206/12929_1 /TAXON_ID=223996 /ORGANISM="Protocruzia adherens, Strain Boccale" /LENGTH=98 /DNA_ID=CAMNT_0002357879 /DNA_START=21 /DNA_END=314 /DNA_ORIENTATION=-